MNPDPPRATFRAVFLFMPYLPDNTETDKVVAEAIEAAEGGTAVPRIATPGTTANYSSLVILIHYSLWLHLLC